MNTIETIFNQHMETVKNTIDSSYLKELRIATDMIKDTLKNGGKVLIAGNGGSAADAQHFSAELIGRFLKEREAFPAIALSTDSSILTCVSNDYSYDVVFSRQISGLAKEGDLFIGFSTSGNSQNIIEAMNQSKKQNVKTIGFLGRDGGKIKALCDIALVVPEQVTARVQEIHLLSYHIICSLLDDEM